MLYLSKCLKTIDLILYSTCLWTFYIQVNIKIVVIIVNMCLSCIIIEADYNQTLSKQHLSKLPKYPYLTLKVD